MKHFPRRIGFNGTYFCVLYRSDQVAPGKNAIMHISNGGGISTKIPGTSFLSGQAVW
ncbi:MAG: hypothetical protein AAFO69_08670 [Bacteroidota bacterium]